MADESSKDLVEVYVPVDQWEAHAIKQTLEDAGIYCYIDGELTSAWAGGGLLGNAGRWRMRIMVPQAYQARAKEIIDSGDWPSYAPE